MLSHLIYPVSTSCFAVTSHCLEYQLSTESMTDNTSDPKTLFVLCIEYSYNQMHFT